MDDPGKNGLLLRTRDIGRRAPGSDRWLIQGVSLEIFSGEQVALVGPSGSGKSVLLRVLALLDAVDSGTLEMQGRPAGEHNVPEHRRKVIYLHQRPVLFEGTVEFNFERPFSLKGNRHLHYDRGQAISLLRDVGRDESFLQKRFDELSGGEAQIVALIRAIQLNPLILLLDEATASLDDETTASAERIVREWLEQGRERAVVLVSHDREQARHVARRILQLNEGHLSEIAAQ
jgi:putative ABC transport system ATP-binding protein